MRRKDNESYTIYTHIYIYICISTYDIDDVLIDFQWQNVVSSVTLNWKIVLMNWNRSIVYSSKRNEYHRLMLQQLNYFQYNLNPVDDVWWMV